MATSFTGFDIAFAVAIQSDGKIVAAGSTRTAATFDNSKDNFALARYTSTGTLDTTFGANGKVTTDFNASTDEANAVAIQSDGKSVAVGGAVVGGTSDFGIARYTSTGVLDTTFGSNGKVPTDFAGSTDAANAAAIQGDGRILAAGPPDVRWRLPPQRGCPAGDPGLCPTGSGPPITRGYAPDLGA